MGTAKEVDQPGFVAVWRLWRHCLCRHGWFPLLVAPLVTCACLCDVYSSTGCDFVRMNIGFTPANDVWPGSYVQLGVFSFDNHKTDRNKWKRRINDGCQPYSQNFHDSYISSDQTWYISRIMAYTSGIASLVALATAWLLTITPLPASFFWPGVLLPAVVMSMLTGAAKFIFFDTQICTEPLWFVDESSPPVAAESCQIGESSVFGIASVAAYLFCTILICFRSPQKRTLDPGYGIRPDEPASTVTQQSDLIGHDPERGHSASDVSSTAVAVAGRRCALGIEQKETIAFQDSQRARNVKSPNHGPFHGSTRKVGALSPQAPKRHGASRAEWNNSGRPVVVTIDENDPEGRDRSYSDGSTTQSSSKSTERGLPNNRMRPPRHNGTRHNPPSAAPVSSIGRSEHGSHGSPASRSHGSPASRRSKPSLLSFPASQGSDDVSALGMHSYATASVTTSSAKNAPSVVAIPRRHRNMFPSGISHSAEGKKLRHKGGFRDHHNYVYLNEHNHETPSVGSRLDPKRIMHEYLPPLDEMSATRSLEDHGDLISQCVRDLHKSFDDDGFGTI